MHIAEPDYNVMKLSEFYQLNMGWENWGRHHSNSKFTFGA
jgi:hypothetical protein